MRAGQLSIVLTKHVLDRYIERVKPHLDRSRAEAELHALVGLAGTPNVAPPAWASHCADRAHLGDAGLFLAISDGIVLALVPDVTRGVPVLLAVTLLTRTGMSSEYRARRRTAEANRRAARRTRRLHEKGKRNRRRAA